MRDFLQTILKYVRYFPDAKLAFIYELKQRHEKGMRVIYTSDKKVAKRYKHARDIEIRRRLICRTLY